MRLSRKAQDAVEELTAQLSVSVRKVAAELAIKAGKEFADQSDVKEAYRLMILQISEKLPKG